MCSIALGIEVKPAIQTSNCTIIIRYNSTETDPVPDREECGPTGPSGVQDISRYFSIITPLSINLSMWLGVAYLSKGQSSSTGNVVGIFADKDSTVTAILLLRDLLHTHRKNKTTCRTLLISGYYIY